MKVELTIEDLTPEGVGVARSNGMVYFVRGMVVVGDKVVAEVTRQKKNVTEASLVSLLTPSPHRAEPRCQHYGRCGGCQLQHSDYELQLQWKSRFVLQAMRRIAKVPLEKVDIVPAEKTYNYRAKAHFAFGSAGQKLSIGYFDAANKWFAVQECPIVEHQALGYAFEVSKILNDHHLRSYFDVGMGTLRHLQVRVSQATRQVQVLITLTEPPRSLDSLANEILRAGVDSVAFHINRSKQRTVVGRGPTWVYGEEYLVEQLLGVTYLLSLLSFFQVNPAQAEKLFALSLDYLEPNASDVVFEGYGGVGAISMLYAHRVGKVFLAESNPSSVLDAIRNANTLSVTNMDIMEATTEEALERLTKSSTAVTKVVVDPPRAGMSANALLSIVKLNPQRIVYISCDPGTLARDVSALVAHGFLLKSVTAVDMFPQTTHVESVALLERK